MKNLRLNLLDTSQDFQILEIVLENNGIISPEDLNSFELPKDIDWSKGIVIYGRAPIWLYSFLVHQCHPSAWVAVYDPRYGAIVIEAHKPEAPPVGHIIEQKRILKFLGVDSTEQKIIAFLGNPHTGKSVFLRLLRQSLKSILPPEEFHRNLFVVKACPDGEGDWFSDLGESEAKIYRYKNHFNQEFVERIVEEIDKLRNEKKLLFVDCGGKIDRFNQAILNKCTHCLILGTDEVSIAEWRGAAKLCGLNVICEILSSKDFVSDVISREPLKIVFGFLDRNASNFPEIPKELIQKIL